MNNRTSDSSAAPALGAPGERLPLAASVHIPYLLRGLLPEPSKRMLRELRARILMRGFKRYKDLEQSAEDSLASASVSIVVPVHDAPSVTRRCLASLERYAPKAEVILIDDGSSLTETRDTIRSFTARRGWTLVRHEKPLGHSVACEVGVCLSTRAYLCLLNSDTVVTPWCWRLVKQAFEIDDKIAVAGPSTSHSGNVQALPVALYLRQRWNDQQICDFAQRLVMPGTDPVIEDLAWAGGFAFFIRRTVWNELGGFDRNLPDYGNEVELCKRIAAKGYRRVWVRNAYIHHLGGQSYGESIGEEAIVARKMSTSAYVKEKGALVDG